jgi:hypothetical protein
MLIGKSFVRRSGVLVHNHKKIIMFPRITRAPVLSGEAVFGSELSATDTGLQQGLRQNRVAIQVIGAWT